MDDCLWAGKTSQYVTINVCN